MECSLGLHSCPRGDAGSPEGTMLSSAGCGCGDVVLEPGWAKSSVGTEVSSVPWGAGLSTAPGTSPGSTFSRVPTWKTHTPGTPTLLSLHRHTRSNWRGCGHTEGPQALIPRNGAAPCPPFPLTARAAAVPAGCHPGPLLVVAMRRSGLQPHCRLTVLPALSHVRKALEGKASLCGPGSALSSSRSCGRERLQAW